MYVTDSIAYISVSSVVRSCPKVTVVLP
jgi:hypothetical protein